MGGALISGWRRAGAISAPDLILRDPHPSDAARHAAWDGAVLNGPLTGLAEARTVVLAVKPQAWRTVTREVAPYLAQDAIIVSILAGVAARDLSEIFPGRTIVRAMPTTAAAVLKGATSVWAADSLGRDVAHRLFEGLGAIVDLPEETQIHAATAASGSAPAYIYALVEALEAAGIDSGLAPEAARALSRSALIGAAALLEQDDVDAGDLRRQVTSPGGTTEAALRILTGAGGLGDLMGQAVRAAVTRSRELGA
jgi:pyrroline-5-carboxylate reductase